MKFVVEIRWCLRITSLMWNHHLISNKIIPQGNEWDFHLRRWDTTKTHLGSSWSVVKHPLEGLALKVPQDLSRKIWVYPYTTKYFVFLMLFYFPDNFANSNVIFRYETGPIEWLSYQHQAISSHRDEYAPMNIQPFWCYHLLHSVKRAICLKPYHIIFIDVLCVPWRISLKPCSSITSVGIGRQLYSPSLMSCIILRRYETWWRHQMETFS